MNAQTPAEIYNELYVRSLVAKVHEKMRRYRPLISRATILDAFKIEDYQFGNPLQQRILDVAKETLASTVAQETA